MSWISEAHSQWHMVNGADAVCPLDCGAGETYDEYDWEYGNVICGHCKERQRSVDHVRLCPER